MRRSQAPHLRMTTGLQFIVVELDKFIKEVRELSDQREAWCWFLKHSKEIRDKNMKEELMRKGKDMGQAIKQLWKLSSDELLREEIEAEDKFRQDHEASLLTSYRKGQKEGREEGRKEGEEKGREEGREEGEEKGRKEGREEGREEGRKDVALKLLKQGVEPSLICETTGLSKEELNRLKG